jgi:hypothetical protein
VLAGARFAEASGIATDSAGNTLAAWSLMPEEGERVLARWVSPSGALGPQVDLSPGSRGFEPRVAMAPSGRAFVVWRFSESNEQTVIGRWVEHDGTLGPLLTLATPDPGKLEPVEPRVAVDLAGVATVSWRNDAGGNPEIRLRRISPGSAVGPVSDKIGSGGATQIADLPNGTTVVAWRSTGTELNTVSADGTVGTAETISSTNATADPELGVDQHGNGLVVWRDEDGAPPFILRGARFDTTGSPVGGEFTIDGEAEYLGIRSAIAADTAGNFLVAWVRYVPNKESVTYIRGIDPSGEFRGPPQPISAAGRRAEDAVGAAIDDQGGGAVAWFDYDGTQSSVVGRPIQSVGLPDGDLTELIPAPVEISVLASSQPSLGYAAFLARQRDAVVLRRFLEPPVCRDSEATVTQGRPVMIPPSCTGAGIETTRVVSNPGHGTVGPPAAGSLTLTYTPTPGFQGTDRLTYAVGNDGGSSNPALVTIKVGKDTVKPRIKRFRFVRGKHDKFVLRLSEPARVAITVDAPTAGAKQSKRTIAGRVRSKRFSRKVVIAVRGKLARKLQGGGRFRATAVATDPARNRSKPKRLKIALKLAR